MKPTAISLRLLLVTLTITGAMNVEQVQAQSIVAAPNSTGTTVKLNGSSFDITGGQSSKDEANLFHAFTQFGLNSQQTANFILSNPKTQNILAHVIGGNPSVINGLIRLTNGNANLFLINPAGIVFGANARLDVKGAFTATTATSIGFDNNQWLNVSGSNTYNELAGKPSAFAFKSTSQPGSIINAGNLAVGQGQNLTLLGGTVVNTGQLSAPGGNITIAAVPGQKLVRISQEGHLLSLDIQSLPNQPTNWTLPILSLPTLLTGQDPAQATKLTVNSDGTISLTGSSLRADAGTGTVIASGKLNATNTASGQTGGAVQVVGDKVGLISSTINAAGTSGGGTVLIGGLGSEYQGKATLPIASRTFVSGDSAINADAQGKGNGGRVIVQSGNATSFYGSISALGGSPSGDGGYIEVSGKQNLLFRGTAHSSANQGQPGTLLVETTNIKIDNGSTDTAGVPTSIFKNDPSSNSPTITQGILENLDPNIKLRVEARNDITIGTLTNNTLTFNTNSTDGSGGPIIFKADDNNNGQGSFSMNSTATINAGGRDLNISGASVKAGNINALTDTTVVGDINLSGAGNVEVQTIRGKNVTLSSNNGDITVGSVLSEDFSSKFDSLGNLIPPPGTSVNLTAQAGNIQLGTDKVQGYIQAGFTNRSSDSKISIEAARFRAINPRTVPREVDEKGGQVSTSPSVSLYAYPANATNGNPQGNFRSGQLVLQFGNQKPIVVNSPGASDSKGNNTGSSGNPLINIHLLKDTSFTIGGQFDPNSKTFTISGSSDTSPSQSGTQGFIGLGEGPQPDLFVLRPQPRKYGGN